MVQVIGVLVAVFVVVLLAAVVTGRARVSTCCRYVPPDEDLRVRDVPVGGRPQVTG